MSRKQATSREREAAENAFEQVLLQQSSASRVGPIDFSALNEARLKAFEADISWSLHLRSNPYRLLVATERKQMRAFDDSWSRIKPAMQEIWELLQANAVDNLYWIGPLSLGSDSEHECFEFMFQPGIEDSLVEKLAGPILGLVQQNSPDDHVFFYSWQSLTVLEQIRWSTDAIPLFKTVSPSSYIN